MRRILAFSFVGISFLVAGFVFVGLSYDATYDAYVDEDDPFVESFLRIGRDFRDRGMVFIVLESYKNRSLALEELNSVVTGVEELPWVSHVYSVLDALKFGRFDLMRFDLPFEPYVAESDGILTLDEEILNDPLYSDLLISSDGESFSVLVTLDIDATHDNQEIVESIRSAIENNTGMSYFLIGENVANYATFRSIRDLTLVYPPFVLLAIVVVYYARFRRPVLPLLSLLPAVLSAVWITGIMNVLERQINILTVMIPTFIMIIGSAYGMHFLTVYDENGSIQSHSDRIRRTVREERIPVFFSAFTTMAGFSSYLFLDMQAFRDLGLFVCLGIFLSALLTITLLPNLLVNTRETRPGKRRLLVIKRMPALITRSLTYAVILLCFLSPLLISRISMNIDQYAFFREDSEVSVAAREMRERFGWISIYYLMMRLPEEDQRTALIAPELRAFGETVEHIAEIEGMKMALDIGTYSRITGVPEPILLRVLQGNEELQNAAALFAKEEAVRAIFFSPLSDTESAGTLLNEVNQILETRREEFQDLELVFAGTPLIWRSVNSNVVANQIQSLTISFLMIAGMLFFIFRNIAFTFAITVPILLTALFNFVIMSVGGISLNISTALISGMLMGLVIDYSIHFTVWYRRYRDTSKTLEKTSGPIIANASGLVVGFLVLFTAPLLLYVDVALLMVGGLSFGAMTTLVMLPGIIRRLQQHSGKRSQKTEY